MELKEFKITVLPLRAKLLNYARKLTDEPEDAEDAVQEVLLKLWNKRLELEQYRSIEAFAMTLTHNICIDMWRCKRNDTLSLDIMHEIIDSLPNLQRTIMRMKDIEGYETDEIAEITGCGPEAIRSNLSRARKKVRDVYLRTIQERKERRNEP